MFVCFFFFNDTATTEIYTLSLHDALPILQFDFGYFLMPGTQRSLTLPDAVYQRMHQVAAGGMVNLRLMAATSPRDRKSTRLNSSHSQISYAVFCLKKKKTHHRDALPHIAI